MLPTTLRTASCRIQQTCCICKKPIPLNGTWAFGNNAEPVASGRCCDDCNSREVIPARSAAPPDPWDDADEIESITGRQMARIRRMPARKRAKVAFDLLYGRAELHNLTVKQVIGLTKAPLVELNKLRTLEAGCSLRERQRQRRAERVVGELGVERIMQVLRLFPLSVAAAE